MNEAFLNSYESPPDITVVSPPAESLLHNKDNSSAWPEGIKKNKELERNSRRRDVANKNLESLFTHIPLADMEIQTAIKTNLLEEKDVTATYESLSRLLEDPSNDRLILYVPFELVPDQTWKPESKELREATQQFTRLYMEGWDRLLSVRDVRANFVDGDIPYRELRQAPLPRVVKAAHLIPKLVEKGLLSVSEVIQLMEDNQGSTLHESIANTLPVLADMGFIEKKQLEIEKLPTEALEKNKNWIHDLPSCMKQELASANRKLPKKLPVARTRWLKKEREREIVEKYAGEIADALAQNSLMPSDIEKLASTSKDRLSTLTGINAIRKTVETLAHTDTEQAQTIQKTYDPLIQELWQNATPETKDALTSILSRWHAAGVVDKLYLEQFGIRIPKFDLPFSADNAEIKEELLEISPIIKAIELNPELAKFFYPAAILFGSRVKGYGTRTADLDVAVFVRPDTPIEERPRAQKLLSKILAGEKIQGKALEFWLAREGDNLCIQDFPNPDTSLGDSNLPHVLFNGAWSGNKATIKELHEKLLPGYLYSKGKTVDGRDARKIWLEEMERDTLQYRLMHKGYAQFFPEQGGMHAKHADAIDGKSVFWDSGYRRLAIKLFIQKVFLPQLEKIG